jgi:hypothetical protein
MRNVSAGEGAEPAIDPNPVAPVQLNYIFPSGKQRTRSGGSPVYRDDAVFLLMDVQGMHPATTQAIEFPYFFRILNDGGNRHVRVERSPVDHPDVFDI